MPEVALVEPGPILPYAPTITLNGVKWPLPKLAPRQLRYVVPRMVKLLKSLAGMADLFADIRNGTDNISQSQLVGKLMQLDIDEELIDNFYSVIYTSLTRGTPKLTEDQFLDTPMTLQELIEALPVVMNATGLWDIKNDEATPKAQEGAIQGEASPT